MTERPAIFNAPMVRAILAGDKTQMRPVLKPQPDIVTSQVDGVTPVMYWRNGTVNTPLNIAPGCLVRFCPYGGPGDTLWVRETFAEHVGLFGESSVYLYRADFEDGDNRGGPWKPSIHMPRWASRLTLRVTGVRVERVQDISDADARAEGIVLPSHTCTMYDGIYRDGYKVLWDANNAKRGHSWASNPWVWVVEFERVK